MQHQKQLVIENKVLCKNEVHNVSQGSGSHVHHGTAHQRAPEIVTEKFADHENY